MSKSAVVTLSFWLVLAFVTWNVIFDRHVSVAAVAFTREQTRNHLAGRPVVSIEDGFSPGVTAASRRASLWAGAVVILGAVASAGVARSGRSARSPAPSR